MADRETAPAQEVHECLQRCGVAVVDQVHSQVWELAEPGPVRRVLVGSRADSVADPGTLVGKECNWKWVGVLVCRSVQASVASRLHTDSCTGRLGENVRLVHHAVR